jgi:hypothetical protein
MIIGKKTLGLSFFNSTFVNGSNTEYEMKKMVSVRLYWILLMPRSS